MVSKCKLWLSRFDRLSFQISNILLYNRSKLSLIEPLLFDFDLSIFLLSILLISVILLSHLMFVPHMSS